ncbi:MAG: lysophospholipase [Bacillota bacterium]|nr:lysophospholipase [Bacillota bacterium]
MFDWEGYLPRGPGRLHYWELRPTGAPPKGLVAIVHGVGEHSGRHRRLAEFLVDRGYEVLLHDLRGHGRTDGLRGHVDRFEDYTDDLRALVDVRNFPGPAFVLGHSLGGLIAAAFAQSYSNRLTGFILSSPCLKLRVVPPRWKQWLARQLHPVIPHLQLSSWLRPEALAHDRRVVAAYRADPLCFGQVTLQWYMELVRKMAEVNQRASSTTLPALVLQAGDDALVDPEGIRDFFARLGSQDKKLVVYDGAYHEIFNEDCQAQAREEVAAWLDAHSARPCRA